MIGKWRPFGDQLAWACRVCENRSSEMCRDCRCEKETHFEFDPRQYIKLCQEFSNGLHEGDRYWFVKGERGGGKIVHLETRLAQTRAELKEAREARDAYKQLADDLSNIIKEMVRKNGIDHPSHRW